jgi:hypothetical protein
LFEENLTRINDIIKQMKEMPLVSFEANINPANIPLTTIQSNFSDKKYLYKLIIRQKVNAARRDS